MKAYVITLLDVPASAESAQNTLKSAQLNNLDAQIYPATHWSTAARDFHAAGLRFKHHPKQREDRALGNFLSHYRLWAHIRDSEPALILEHDDTVIAPLPPMSGDIVQCGQPHFGRGQHRALLGKPPNAPGVYPLFSKDYGHFMGSHAYYVTPAGGAKLCEAAHRLGGQSTDDFINMKDFPDLKELWPWIATTSIAFSTIRRRGPYKII